MICNKCKRDLPESYFFPDRIHGGYYYTCKDCRKQYINRFTKPKYKYYTPCNIPSVVKIVNKACKLFNISVKDFYSDCRLKEFALARKWVCQQLNDTTKMSSVQIGNAVHFHHTTVMYSCQEKSRLMVSEYLRGLGFEKKLIQVKHMNYQTGEITVEYIPEKKQKWIKINLKKI